MAGRKTLKVTLIIVLFLAMALPAGFSVALEVNYIDFALAQDTAAIAEAKISSEVKESIAILSDDETIEILILLKEQTDTARVAEKARQNMPPWVSAQQQKMQSRAAVVNALQDTAERTQGNLISYLAREQGLGKVEEYKRFFIVNIIYARVTAEVIDEISRRPEVDQILPNAKIELIEPVNESEEIKNVDEILLSDMGSIGSNIVRIGVPEVWGQYGLDGTGVVIGIIDTGVYWEHEALKEKWRGYNPDDPDNSDPTYNWFDAVEDSIIPVDDIGHGTHVTGIAVGSDPENENPIGVAPGAQWIAARAFNEWGGPSSWILAAAEYMLAPTDQNGVPNPEMAPDIINNSWGSGPGLKEWFRPMAQAWRSAGIMPIFAAGNDGPDEGTVAAPANYPESFAVAATWAWNDHIAAFSSRGPSPYEAPDDLKPDISAPGGSIRSSMHDGGYDNHSGTSMAAPHLAGVSALLLSLDNNINVDQLEALLIDSAEPLVNADYPDSPNYAYGYGIVNALKAIIFHDEGYGKVSGLVLADGVDGLPLDALITVVETGRSVSTDPSDGSFSFYHPAGQSLTLQVESDGYETFEQSFHLEHNSELDFGAIIMHEAAFIYGTVINQDNNPLQANITVLETGLSTATDATNGTFTLQHPAGNDWTLQTESYGYSVFQQSFDLAAKEALDLGFIILDEAPTGTLSGTVVNTNSGQPVAGAVLSLSEDPNLPLTFSGYDGTFQINNIHEGMYTILILAERYDPASASAAVIGGETTELTIELDPFALLADFSEDITTGSQPLDVQFTDTSSGAPGGWAWYFGDEDFSAEWIEMTDEIPWRENNFNLRSVVLPDGTITVIDSDLHNKQVWNSKDQGATWLRMTANAEWSFRRGVSVVSLPDGSIVLMGGYDGKNYNNDVWRSSDQGATWTLMTANASWSPRFNINSVALPDGSIVIIGGRTGPNSTDLVKDVWISKDQGANWIKVKDEVELDFVPGWPNRALALPDGTIIVIIRDKVWRSADHGYTWEKMMEDAEWDGDSQLAALPDGSIIRLSRNSIWRSTNQGASWTHHIKEDEWLPALGPSVVLPDGSIVIIFDYDRSDGSDPRGVWRMETAGSTEQNPVHTYTEPGVYSVALQAYNNEDYHSIRKESLITVGHIQYEINVTADPSEGGAVTGGGSYEHGEEVSVTATPNEGYQFVNWTEWTSQGPVLSMDSTYSFEAKSDRVLIANFRLKSYTLNYQAEAGGNIIGETVQTVYHGSHGTGVTAIHDDDYHFVGWSDGIESSFRIETNVVADLSVTAEFASGAYVPISADFTADNTSGGTPFNVQFTDTSQGRPTGWTWYFGDEDFSKSWVKMTDNAGWAGFTHHSCVALPDDSILVMGGYDRYNSNNEVWRSKDYGASWTLMTDSAEWAARTNHTSLVLPDGSIVLMGGWDGSFRNDVWRSTDYGITWYQVTDSAEWSARGSHSSVLLNDGSILIMGGMDNRNPFNDVWRSTDQGATWVQVTESANWAERFGHSSVALSDSSIVLMGGRTGPMLSDQVNDVWHSKDNGATWTNLTENAEWSARDRQTSLVLADNSIILIGGGSANSEVWRSTDKGATWALITDNAEWPTRSGARTVVLLDGSIVLMGGATANDDYYDVWRLETAGSNDQNPVYSYSDPGIYDVSLQSYDANESHLKQKERYITAYGLHNVSISIEPHMGGTVSGAGTYGHGEEVTVTATANEGYGFINWTEDGEEISTEPSYTFTAESDRDLVANFALLTGKLEVFIEPEAARAAGARWSIDGGQSWQDSGVKLELPANNHQIQFKAVLGWKKPDIINISLEENETKTIESNYVRLHNIQVTASPPWGGNLDGGGFFEDSADIVVTAWAASGYMFDYWSENGQVVSEDIEYSFVTDRDRNLVANFFDLAHADRTNETEEHINNTFTSHSIVKPQRYFSVLYEESEKLITQFYNDGGSNLVFALDWPDEALLAGELEISVYYPPDNKLLFMLKLNLADAVPPVVFAIEPSHYWIDPGDYWLEPGDYWSAPEGTWNIGVKLLTLGSGTSADDLAMRGLRYTNLNRALENENGEPTNSFPFWLMAGRLISHDASLASLEVNLFSLVPDFDPGIFEYSVQVAENVEFVEIIATPLDQKACVSVNGDLVNSGEAATVFLGDPGSETLIDILVTAEDETTVKPYLIIVDREMEPLNNDAKLSSLTVEPGTLDPAFDSGTFLYTVAVAHYVESIDVTATASDENAKMFIDGAVHDSGAAKTIPLGEQGTSSQIAIVVTAEDGETEKTYTVTVNRLDLEQTFTDVPPDHPFFAEIEALAASGITTGFPDGNFRPSGIVTRQAMAAFLYRGLELEDVAVTVPTFSDVPITHPFFTEIEALAASGITTGYPDGTFRPSANVTRQATSAFLYRGLELEDAAIAEPTFSDVPATHPFFTEIEALAASGITTGFPDGTFRPSNPVTRQATAAFLVRGLELE